MPALRLALKPWQGLVTLLSRCCQMLGCRRLRGVPGHTPETGPGGSGEKLGLTREVRSGTSVRNLRSVISP